MIYLPQSIGYLIEDLATGTKKYNGISKLGGKGIPRRIDIMYTTPYEYPFASIQHAVDAANDYDLVEISPGEYFENVVINKNIHHKSYN